MLSPLSFTIGHQTFSTDAFGYLIDGIDIEPQLKNMCVIGVMPLPETVSNTGYTMYLLGDSFLRGFYSVYDYNDQSVRLAVNVHAKDYASIVTRADHKWSFLIITFSAMASSAIIFMVISRTLRKHMQSEVREYIVMRQ